MTRAVSLSRWLTGCVLLIALGPQAHGNGRAPLTNGIYFKGGDPHSLYIRSTFGLLISHDDGCTFTWHCEASIGYGGTYDPSYAVATDSTIYATTYTGVRISRDDGCSFSNPDVGPAANIGAIDIGPTDEVWIATADTAHANGVYRSTDRGVTFSAVIGEPATMQWSGVRVAPGNPQRIYVAGISNAGSAYFATSADGGSTWTPSTLTNVQQGSPASLRLLAVDPRDELTLYVTVDAVPGGRLYRTTDAGQTFTEVLTSSGTIAGVAIKNSVVIVAADSVAYRSADAGVSFSMMTGAPRLACIGRQADGMLLGCGANWDPDFKAVTRSVDDGTSWDPVWRFVQLSGPATCPVGTAETDACAPLWPTLKAQFGATGPTCGEHVWGSDPPRPVESGGGGCCDAGGGFVGDSFVWAFLVVVTLLPRRR